MEQQYLTIWDLVITPIYLIVLIWIARRFRDKHYPEGHPLRKYYLPGLLAKFGGAIFIGLIYQYYYHGGDTFSYFTDSRVINSSLGDSINLWAKLILRQSPETDPYIYKYSSQLSFYNDSSAHSVSAISAILGLLNGTTYMPIALLFAYLSYTGIWAMYKTFAGIYPSLYKELAIAFLFVPSTVVWGSSIFKDTLCMFCLGWMTCTVFRIFIYRDYSLKNLFLLAGSFLLVAVVKIYILISFLPALSIWILMTYSKRIDSRAVRFATNIIFVFISVASLYFLTQKFENELGRYSLDRLANTAKVTQRYISAVSRQEEGSVYDLGEFEPTFGSMIAKFPQAVVVTLFRPFLWEVRKPIVLLSALESVTFLGLFVFALFKGGIGKTLRFILTDPTLLFLFVYSLIFAFAVGISTGNFGSLSRYKIPCMPFFAAFLLIVIFKKTRTMALRKSVRSVTGKVNYA